MSFDEEKFISLVKERESLWNYKCVTYSDKEQRRRDWMCVGEEMIPDFKTKMKSEKYEIVMQLQTKWKVFRDSYTRSVKNCKRAMAKSGTVPKLYRYYHQLNFLSELYDQDDKLDIPESSSPEPEGSKRPRLQEKFRSKRYYKEPRSEEKTSSKLQKPVHNEIDEDKMFLMSLLCDFKRIPADQKLDAKGDIINVIRRYKNTLPQIHTDVIYLPNATDSQVADLNEQRHSQTTSYFKPEVPNDSFSDGSSDTEIKCLS